MRKKEKTAIDTILKRLTASLDVSLNESGAKSQNDRAEVGYFELRALVEYVEEQRKNFILLEKMVNTVSHTEKLLGMPTLLWRNELRLGKRK